MQPHPTIQDVLGKGGILARRLEGYRERAPQLRMADAVAAALRSETHLMVEAPTGVGKSLAYLVPILLELVAKGKKVVVSTHTIALQEQLISKDLPLLASCLPIEFATVKALGRSNYLGLRRMELALARAPSLMADDPEVLALRRIAAWSVTADEGRRQELDPAPRPGIWEQVQSEGDNCLGRACRHYEACFYQAARRRLQHADVIVTNHALYFTDLMLRRFDMGVLPEHDAVVLDEAHQIESVASDHFGLEFSHRGINHLLRRLAGGRGSNGLLHRLDGDAAERIHGLVKGLRVATGTLFDQVESWLDQRPGSNGRVREPAFVENPVGPPLLELGTRLARLAESCPKEDLAVELEAFAQRATASAAALRAVLAVDDPDMVYFVERNRQQGHVALLARPLEVGPILETDLFERVSSVILTSATLGSGDGEAGLGYTATRLGCPSIKRIALGSPFDMARQVAAWMPADLPSPDDAGYEEAACSELRFWIRRTGGGAFILFTSYRSLDRFHRRLLPDLSPGLLVLRQGPDQDRARMLDRFREDGNAVLFGTESFWQGVDVPGPALRMVAITRLPFPVPTLPMNEARAERLRVQGRDPFRDHALPEALIRFRQGLGRLIRREDDEGVLLVLDPRILHRSYGRRFREALGDVPWSVGSPEDDEQALADRI